MRRPKNTGPRCGHDDARGPRGESGHLSRADGAGEGEAVGLPGSVLGLLVRREREERRARALLLEGDLERGELAARRIHNHFHRRGRPNELLRLRNLNCRSRPEPGRDIHARNHQPQDHNQHEQLAHDQDGTTGRVGSEWSDQGLLTAVVDPFRCPMLRCSPPLDRAKRARRHHPGDNRARAAAARAARCRAAERLPWIERIRQQPDDITGYLALSSLYYMTRRYDDAERFLMGALTLVRKRGAAAPAPAASDRFWSRRRAPASTSARRSSCATCRPTIRWPPSTPAGRDGRTRISPSTNAASSATPASRNRSPGLDEAALAAVRRWEFLPTIRAGRRSRVHAGENDASSPCRSSPSPAMPAARSAPASPRSAGRSSKARSRMPSSCSKR